MRIALRWVPLYTLPPVWRRQFRPTPIWCTHILVPEVGYCGHEAAFLRSLTAQADSLRRSPVSTRRPFPGSSADTGSASCLFQPSKESLSRVNRYLGLHYGEGRHRPHEKEREGIHGCTVHICIYIYVHMFFFSRLSFPYICSHVQKNIYIYIYIYICIYVCMYVCIYTSRYMCVCILLLIGRLSFTDNEDKKLPYSPGLMNNTSVRDKDLGLRMEQASASRLQQ